MDGYKRPGSDDVTADDISPPTTEHPSRHVSGCLAVRGLVGHAFAIVLTSAMATHTGKLLNACRMRKRTTCTACASTGPSKRWLNRCRSHWASAVLARSCSQARIIGACGRTASRTVTGREIARRRLPNAIARRRLPCAAPSGANGASIASSGKLRASIDSEASPRTVCVETQIGQTLPVENDRSRVPHKRPTTPEPPERVGGDGAHRDHEERGEGRRLLTPKSGGRGNVLTGVLEH